jgi:Rrf2 family iron-sulfur cluster assembly transcriptional regulator
MNLLSRRSVLAIAAVVDVTLHSRSAPVTAKGLAARHKLPSRHLETLLQGLVHAKILKSVRGPRGGYELARERRRITVGEIVRTAMSLSTVDPENLGANSVLLERVIDPAVRRAGNLSRQSRFDHGRTGVRHRREDACARRREGQRRSRYLVARPAKRTTRRGNPCSVGRSCCGGRSPRAAPASPRPYPAVAHGLIVPIVPIGWPMPTPAPTVPPVPAPVVPSVPTVPMAPPVPPNLFDERAHNRLFKRRRGKCESGGRTGSGD